MRDKIIRADKEFDELISRIARQRIIKGIDRRPRSSRRITMAIRRHPLMREIEKDIENADLDLEGRR